MKIAIIDADLIERKNHRFPNLACEKLSGFWKSKPDTTVELKTDYDNLSTFDKVFVSKVFTDTPFPDLIKYLDNVEIGGTGFFFDKAENLPYDIEHHKPDYSLYDGWIENEIQKARKAQGEKYDHKKFMVQFKEYTDYSIGFLTRGCFRRCEFCVNKKYDHVFVHSPLEEFFDPTRKKLCFLDDNFFGLNRNDRTRIFDEILSLKKRYKFKQGLDERLLTEEIASKLFASKYDGDLTFAFDNIEDYEIIKKKLEIIHKYNGGKPKKGVMFYVLVGFVSTGIQDIENAFKRIALLMKYKCIPYIMRYHGVNDAPWKESKYKGMYVALARWSNQPNLFKKMSFREFCEANQKLHKNPDTLCASMKALTSFELENPDIAKKYFDLKYSDY